MLDEIVFEDAKRPNTVSGQSIESVPHIEEISIVGSVVECSPATRAARVRFQDDATIVFFIATHDCPVSLPSHVLIHLNHWMA